MSSSEFVAVPVWWNHLLILLSSLTSCKHNPDISFYKPDIKVVETAQNIVGTHLPSISDVLEERCLDEAQLIVESILNKPWPSSLGNTFVKSALLQGRVSNIR